MPLTVVEETDRRWTSLMIRTTRRSPARDTAGLHLIYRLTRGVDCTPRVRRRKQFGTCQLRRSGTTRRYAGNGQVGPGRADRSRLQPIYGAGLPPPPGDTDENYSFFRLNRQGV